MKRTSYFNDIVTAELVDAVGEEHVLTSEAERLPYSTDVFWIPKMWIDRGMEPPMPDWVVQPGTVPEVQKVVKIAARHRIPLVPWGGGSGSQGGVLPIYGGITLDMKRLNQILEINDQSLFVRAMAGINGQQLEWALNRRGYTLPHYPASANCATLGGYLAHRGSGVLSTKYGKIEAMTMALEVVLPDGEVMRTLPVPSHASGPGLHELFIGSEGTLGIITEATLKIQRLPEERRFRACLFDSLSAGLEAGRQIMLARLQPTVIRLYDERSTEKVVKRVLGLDVQGAYMIYGFDGWKDIVDCQEKRAREIIEGVGGVDLGPEGGKHWWVHRYDFYFPPYDFSLPWMFGTMDTLSTFDKIEQLYRSKKQAIESEFSEWNAQYIAHFSHWYDWGVMVYDRFIVEEPPEDPHEAIRLHNRIWDRAVRISLANGGVINEHHGIGLKLSRFMPEQYGEGFEVLRKIKAALDPDGLFNPGKLGFGPPRGWYSHETWEEC